MELDDFSICVTLSYPVCGIWVLWDSSAPSGLLSFSGKEGTESGEEQTDRY